MKRLLAPTLAILIAAAIALALGSAGTAASYPPQAPELQISRSTLAPGNELLITGHGFRPETLVKLLLHRTNPSRTYPLGTPRANQHGAITTRLRIPTDIPRGHWLLIAEGESPTGQPLHIQAVLAIH